MGRRYFRGWAEAVQRVFPHTCAGAGCRVCWWVLWRKKDVTEETHG